ncbi:leucyl aminopeptidase [soil metagenome]
MPSKLTVLMQISMKRLSAARKDDHLVILAEQDSHIPSEVFSADEQKFIKKERAASKKLILVNQYNRMVYLQILDETKKSQAHRLEIARKTGAALCSRIQAAKHTAVVISTKGSTELLLACAEGMALGNYQFLKYRSAKKTEQSTLKEISLVGKGLTDKEVAVLSIAVKATCIARDLVNEPQSFLTATELGNQFKALGKEAGFKVEVFNKVKIRQLKMGGLLAVNQGSIDPPTFTVMEYKPKKAVNKKPIILVGKGVVYDTGGMSLKPTANSMDYMKCDMAGGAVVGATLFAIAKAKLNVHVIGLVPATDNRPDGNAYVPGDVITMMSGKTVEVLNTDAEGRLILADALHYAKKYSPELVMEFSTLTGAASAAIGPYGIVCMGKLEESTRKELHASGENVFERLAEFPFWEEYDEMIKSDIADIKNVGGASGGAITAGRFLAQFVDYPYMHFDIAGPAFTKSNDSYRGKNGTGVGVRLMFDFLSKRSK